MADLSGDPHEQTWAGGRLHGGRGGVRGDGGRRSRRSRSARHHRDGSCRVRDVQGLEVQRLQSDSRWRHLRRQVRECAVLEGQGSTCVPVFCHLVLVAAATACSGGFQTQVGRSSDARTGGPVQLLTAARALTGAEHDRQDKPRHPARRLGAEDPLSRGRAGELEQPSGALRPGQSLALPRTC